ncbi:MAG: M1 family metallopeptidase [Acidimicrobiales bacterium]
MSRRIAVVVAGVVGVGLVVLGAALVMGHDDEPAGSAATSSTTSSTMASTTTTELIGQPGADGVGDPYFPLVGNGGYDVAHYTLALTWHPDTGSIDGVTTIEATATQDLSRFDLDLSGLEVASVTVDGAPAAVQRADRELQITPPTTIASGRSFSTVVSYSGVPHPVSDGTDLFEVGWQRDGREAYVVSEPVGAATFFPVNDHPTDKATYTFKVTAPADQVVAANGLLTGSQDLGHGAREWTYEAHDPMASYLVQIAIGDYELVDDGTVGGVVIRHAFHRSSPATAARRSAARTAEMIDVLDEVYGPFPFEAYGVLVVDEPLGFALETQTLTILGSDLGSLSRNTDLVLLHELSHQWVGDAVSLVSWKDIWLNEGFATYSEWLWTERTGGQSAAASARLAGRRSDLDAPPGDPGAAELFTRSVYLRGGMTLQALRETIGDVAFFEVLRTWVDEHRGGSASTADFVALAERMSNQHLGDLFQRWLYTPGLPALG